MNRKEFNDIGISRQLDGPRIKKLLAIGLFGSLLHLAGDLILGWGVENEALDGMERLISAYTATADGGIFAAALLGLIGMTIEALSFFGVYRLIAAAAPDAAHRYRSGIFGYAMFGACGFHVPMCAGVSDEARPRPGASFAVQRVFPASGARAFLGLFRRAGDYAASRVCPRRNAISALVLGVLSAGRYGRGDGRACVRKPRMGQCRFLRVDRYRLRMDVRRTAGHAEEMPRSGLTGSVYRLRYARCSPDAGRRGMDVWRVETHPQPDAPKAYETLSGI